MDGQRFDRLTRAFVSPTGRRGFLKGVAGAIFGGAAMAKVTADADAACKAFGHSCPGGQADCCTGLTCSGGYCKCGAGQEKCNAAGVITCVEACKGGEYMGSSCRCLCLSTGRPPVNGRCGCGPGLTDCGDGTCKDLSSDPQNCGGCSVGETSFACPSGQSCRGGTCLCTADSQCPAAQFCDAATGQCVNDFPNGGGPCNRPAQCQNGYCNPSGTCDCNGTVRLSGSASNPNAPFNVDNDIEIYVNGVGVVAQSAGPGSSPPWTLGPYNLPASFGDQIRIRIFDGGGIGSSGPYFLHCLASGQVQTLDPVGIPGGTPSPSGTPGYIYDQTFTVQI